MHLVQMAFIFFFFSGVGWESVLLTRDDITSEAIASSSADMTVKVRHPFSSVILYVHLYSRGPNPWATSNLLSDQHWHYIERKYM